MAKPIRLALSLTPEDRDKMDELADRSGSGKKIPMIRNAIRLYETIVDAALEGQRICLVKDGVSTRVLIPGLEA